MFLDGCLAALMSPALNLPSFHWCTCPPPARGNRNSAYKGSSLGWGWGDVASLGTEVFSFADQNGCKRQRSVTARRRPDNPSLMIPSTPSLLCVFPLSSSNNWHSHLLWRLFLTSLLKSSYWLWIHEDNDEEQWAGSCLLCDPSQNWWPLWARNASSAGYNTREKQGRIWILERRKPLFFLSFRHRPISKGWRSLQRSFFF